MPQGIIATVDNGFALVDFVDKSLRGPALAKLVEIGGPESIETVTRVGPRRQYRVPEGNAREAGLLDDEPGSAGPFSAGQDTGSAAALKASDPNVNAGDDEADWHTPVAEYTSANAFVGPVPNPEVMDRPQVHPGGASSSGGSGKTPPHSGVISDVATAKQPPTPGSREALAPASATSGALASQPSALPSDPGGYAAQPDTPPVAPVPAGTQPWPAGEPTEDWKRSELDAYAADKGVDTTGLPNKAAVLAALAGK